jgi:ABC-2 type transport system permease protein
LTELYIFTSSLREFVRFRRLLGWLLILVVVFGMSLVFVRQLSSMSKHDVYLLLSAALVFRILPLCAAIYSTAVINQEVTQRTIVYLLTRPIARWKLLVFRCLAAMVAVALISVGAELVVWVASGMSQRTQMLHDLSAVLVGSLAYTALFTVVSLFVNRPIVICLLFAFVWETAAPAMQGDLFRLTVSGYLTSIAQRPAVDLPSGALDAIAGLLGVNVIPSAVAWASMLGLVAVCLAFGAFWFSKFEYMAREDD